MEKINYQKIFNFLKSAIYYSALFIVPLGMSLFLPIYSPFTMIKSAWFHGLGAAFLLVYLFSFYLSFRKKRIIVNHNFLLALLPWGSFLSALLLLNIFSLNPLQSFFGSYDRQLGFLFYFSLATWFTLIVHHFAGFNKGQAEAFIFWKRGLSNSVLLMSITATLVSIYACLQFTGYDVFLWQEGQLLSRSISSLGQPNFLASFLLFGISMTCYLFYLNKKLFFRLLITISLIIQFLALITSGSRAAWLALLLTIAIYLLIILWRKWHYRALMYSLLVSIIIFSILLLFSPTRMGGLFNWQTGSLALRRSFYQAAPSLIMDNLYLGAGLENGGEVIIKSYEPDWGIFMRINGSSDKLHNSLLDALLQLGVFGFFFYLLLYSFVIYQFVLVWRRPQTRSFAIFAGSALLAYSLSLLFGLADIPNVFYFWVLAALATAVNLIFKTSEDQTSIRFYLNRVFTRFKFKTDWSINIFIILPFTVIIAILASFQIYLSISSIRADHYFLKLHQYSLNQDYATANLLYEYILEDVVNPIHLHNYQRNYAFIISQALEQEPSLKVVELLEKSAKQILLTLPLNSYDNIYSSAVLACSMNTTENSLSKLNTLMSISPKRPNNYISLGDCLAHDKPDLALELYQQSLALLPKRDDPRLRGEQADYLDFYSHLIYYKIATLHYHQHNYLEASSAYSQAYYLYPHRVDILDDLARTYYYLGKYSQSFNALEHANVRHIGTYYLDRLAALAKTINDLERYNHYLESRRNLSGSEFEFLEKDLIFP